MQGIQLKSFAIGALASVGGIFGIAWIANSAGSLNAGIPEKIGAVSAPVNVRADVNALNNAYKDVAEAVNPSVVSISVTVEVEQESILEGLEQLPPSLRERFGIPGGEPYRSKGAGSGVIISQDGYIVTNNHVINDAIEGNGIEVILNDRRSFSASVIGTDELTDLAVIKIDADGLKPAHLGDISDVEVGEIVFAVGNPLGLSGTVTSGIVSAISRGSLGGPRGYHVSNYIQTDAAINPGNSGGGLFDINGSLVGINTAIATETGSYIGYGFSIPIDLVRAVVTDLIEDGKIDRGYIGVAIETIDDNITAKGLGLTEVRGVLVKKVYENSAGKDAGVKRGDVILEVAGKEVASSNELQSIIATYRANDDVELTIFREGEIVTKTVTLKPRDKQQEMFSFNSNKETESDDINIDKFEHQSLGMEVVEMEDELREQYDIKSGVKVANVEKYGTAFNRRIYPGQIITEIDGETINSVSDYINIMQDKQPGEVIKVIALNLGREQQSSEEMIFLEIPKEAN